MAGTQFVSMPDLAGTLTSMVSQPKTATTASTPTTQSMTPEPLYKGPTINSLTGTAKTLGIQHNYDPSTGVFTAAGQKIPVSSIKNGEPYGNVVHLAQAGGHDVAKQPDGTVHVTPAQNSGLNTPSLPAGMPLGPGVYHGGVSMTPYANSGLNTPSNPAGVPLQSGGVNRPFHPVDPLGNVPVQNQSSGLSYLQQRHNTVYNNNGLPAGGLPMGTQTQPTQTQGTAQVSPDTSAGPSGVPQPPAFTPIPTFTPDYSQWQSINPFSYDVQAAFQNALNMYMPQYQQQMATEDSRINEMMNSRGLFNSGIAQAAVNDANAKIYGQLYNAINKYLTQDRAQAYKEWQGQANLTEKQNEFFINQQVNAYKANVQAMYDNGQLSEKQYNDYMNAIDNAATQALNVAKFNQSSLQAAGYVQLPDGSIVPTAQASQADRKLTDSELNSIGLAYGPDGQLHPTLAAQQFNEKTLEAMGLVQGPDGKLHPTLQSQQLTAKILESMGYAQDPTTGKLVPTLAATQDARNYALNLAKVTGYVVNPDGSLTPTLDNVIKTGQLKVAQQNANTNASRTAAEIQHWANQDSLASQRLSLTSKQFEEKQAHDEQMYQLALTNATTSQLKSMITILDGKRNQAASNIRASLAAGQQPRAQDVKDYDDSNKALAQILNAINDGSAYASTKGKKSK
jgi:hypothetical protein